MASQTETDELVALARGLIESWRLFADRKELHIVRGKRHMQFVVVNGLAAHSHRMAAAALSLITDGLVLEALPSVRCAYEFALTAHWVAQLPDGAEALVNETFRQRDTTSQVMLKSPQEEIRTGALLIEGLNRERLPSASDAGGRVFKQRCNDLEPGGADAYLWYRLMSEQVHPGIAAVDNYLTIADTPLGIALRIDPAPATSDEVVMWVSFVGAALVWAGRAVDYFDRSHERRSELRATARRLKINSELHLSKAARDRLAKK